MSLAEAASRGGKATATSQGASRGSLISAPRLTDVARSATAHATARCLPPPANETRKRKGARSNAAKIAAAGTPTARDALERLGARHDDDKAITRSRIAAARDEARSDAPKALLALDRAAPDPLRAVLACRPGLEVIVKEQLAASGRPARTTRAARVDIELREAPAFVLGAARSALGIGFPLEAVALSKTTPEAIGDAVARALAEQEVKLLLEGVTDEARQGLRALTRWLNTQSAASEEEARRRLDEALQRLGRHLSARLSDPDLVIDARQRMAPVYAGRADTITARGEAGAYPTPIAPPQSQRRGALFGGLMGALLGLLVGGGLLWDAQSAAMGAALGAFGGALAGALGERDRRSPR